MESSAEEQENSWITNFCSQRGNEFFCQVDRNYVEDGFNLYGLKSVVENFGESMDVILDRVEPDESDAASAADNRATTELYGLIHARYVVTSHGLDAMHAKYLKRDFGCCPRYYCDNYPVLPLGMNDDVGVARVNVYCPRCRQVFHTTRPSDSVDGAFFGTTFPHLFLMTFGFPRGSAAPPPGVTSSGVGGADSERQLQDDVYVPRVFGFKLHHTAYQRATVSPPVSNAAALDAGLRYGRKRVRDNSQRDDDDDASGSIFCGRSRAAEAGRASVRQRALSRALPRFDEPYSLRQSYDGPPGPTLRRH